MLYHNYLKYFKLFYRHAGHNFFWLLGLVLLSSITEVIGIAMLLPVLELEETSTQTSQVSIFVYKLYASLGVDVSLANLLILIVLIFTIKGAVTFTRILYAERIVTQLVLGLQTTLINSFSRTSYVYYTQLKTGTLTNLIFTEVERFGRSFTKYISVITTSLTVAFYLASAALIRLDLTLGIMAAGIMALYLFRFLVRRTRELSLEMSTISAQGHTHLIQTLQSFLYLRASGSMRRMTARVYDKLSTLIRLRIKLATISATLQSIVEPFAIILLSILIVIQVEVEGRAIAEIAVLALLCHRAFTRLMTIQQEAQRFHESIGGVITVQKEGALLEEHGDGDGESVFETLSSNVEFKNVSFRYGSTPAVEELNLTIPYNKTTGVVGESGAGKSTLILLLAGVIDPTEGVIRTGDKDYREFMRQSLHEKIGYVPQEPVIFNGTVAENITMFTGNAADPNVRQKLEKAARLANCEEFIQTLANNYDTVMGERGINLSGGQKQRIAIAREVYKDPPLMILDEATSALDTDAERTIRDAINSMRGKRTIVVIAHRLSTIRHCDSILVLSQGRLAEAGDYESLIANPTSRFRALVEAQNL